MATKTNLRPGDPVTVSIFPHTLQKFNSSPLKSYRNPIGKAKVFQPPFFRGYVKLLGGITYTPQNPILPAGTPKLLACRCFSFSKRVFQILAVCFWECNSFPKTLQVTKAPETRWLKSLERYDLRWKGDWWDLWWDMSLVGWPVGRAWRMGFSSQVSCLWWGRITPIFFEPFRFIQAIWKGSHVARALGDNNDHHGY